MPKWEIETATRNQNPAVELLDQSPTVSWSGRAIMHER